MAIRTDITIDWNSSPRIITIASPSTEITMQDLYDTLRDAELKQMDEPYLVSGSGKEPLGGGVLVGLTLTLQNALLAFEDRVGPTYTQCYISGGNLVAVDDLGVAFTTPISPTAFTQIVLANSSSATLQELENIQFSSFNGGITVDVGNITGNAVSGTNFPAGTREAPCNNMIDANTIADSRGLSTFFVIGNLTLDNAALNLQDHIFEGESATKTVITLDVAADIYRCEFRYCTVTGVLDGDSIIKKSTVDNIQYFSGFIYDSMLKSSITLGNGAAAHMIDCYSGVPGQDTPIIDMGGSGQSLALRDYVGGITITNKSGDEQISLDLASGQIKFTDTVIAGKILCRGIGQITQNLSRGAIIYDAMVDMSGLIKPPGGIPRVNIVT